MGTLGIGEALAVAYRDLLGAEARLGEMLSPRGIHVGVSVADQWPTLQDYLAIYARGLSPAGVLVLGGAPDEGSRRTGIPFTGPRMARAHLGLPASGAGESAAGAAFWRAVADAQATTMDAPLEALFGTLHLAHAQPFDMRATPEVRDASARHVLRLLCDTRPQVVAAIGSEAVATLARAVEDPRLADLAAAPEASWTSRHPPGTRLLRYPFVDVPCARPFRARVVPVPSLAGAHADVGAAALSSVLTCAWA